MGSKESDTTEQLSLFVLFSNGRIHIRSRKVLVVQLCPTFCDLIDRRSPGCPWDFPGKATGVGCHFLPQGIFLTQGSNPGLLHFRQTLYHLSYQGSHKISGINIINIRYEGDTTLMAESEEELKRLLMKEESEKLA